MGAINGMFSGVLDHEVLDLKYIWLPHSLRREEVMFDLYKIQEMREGMVLGAVFPTRPY